MPAGGQASIPWWRCRGSTGSWCEQPNASTPASRGGVTRKPALRKMILLTVVFLLATVPYQSLGEEDEEESEDSTLKRKLRHQQEIMGKHNEIRRNVDPPAENMLKMVWNETIAESAQNWADECSLNISSVEKRTLNGMMCSENIFYTNYLTTWTKAIEAWEKRKDFFKYGVGPTDTSRSIASYTQLIWYSSYQAGCGVALCPRENDFYFYVCQYCPAANREDLLAKPYKKGQSCKACPDACEDKLCKMLLSTVLLLLAAVVHQSLGKADLSSGSGVSPEVRKEIVDKHNDLRSNVDPTASNMLKMVWNDDIAVNAKNWADQCKLTISPQEQRTINGLVCGENIFLASYPSPWSNVIQVWYNGKSNFKYGVGAIDSKKSIAGFTQIVWYNSYQIGCSVAYCKDKGYPYFYVCQYCPAGNMVNQMATPYKKGTPCGDCPNNCENKLCTNPCKYNDLISNCQQMKNLFSCKEQLLIEKCQASCNCATEIK
uniref:ancylostoma secreted protein-like n=1 Tax=Euleptes europaea TaxID=460621 RepID=UPI0025426705|nr:ancylostoma secreted protein-like [Euleptes europaea]